MIILLICAYLAGSIPFGKLYCRLGHVDIQKRGSGNIGFANVQRIMGSKYGVPTLLSDILKGLLPTLYAATFYDTTFTFVVGLVAILGHIFPIWLRFHGGKGIATGLGVVIILSPLAALLGTSVYLLCLALLRRSSAISSGIGVVFTAVCMAIVTPSLWWTPIILLGLALFTLRDNFRGTVPNYG